MIDLTQVTIETFKNTTDMTNPIEVSSKEKYMVYGFFLALVALGIVSMIDLKFPIQKKSDEQ